MGNDRYRQGQRDPRDYSADSHDTYSSARDYQAAGYYDRGGQRDQHRDRGYGGSNYASGGYQGSYDQRPGDDYGRATGRQGYGGDYRGSYAHDGHRFSEIEDRDRPSPRDEYRDRGRQGQGQWQGRDQQDRGFLDRAGDEVRSWFGDSEAERRRERDARLDQQRDSDYRNWRSGQMAALDRDYDEYRSENRSKFETEFSTWRTDRQWQRTSLGQVNEQMEVVGSDGSHVGTVDKVRGDRILLTKNDQDAGGRHHSIPSRWIDKVDDVVTLRKTADQAKAEWRDEERNQAFFGDDRDDADRGTDRGAGMLNRSFSGTY